MKKISLVIIGGAIALASCNNMPTLDTAKQQGHIDSVVNAFLDAKKADLQKVCDENIMQAAQDSAKMIIENEKKGMHHVVQHAKAVVKSTKDKIKEGQDDFFKSGGKSGGVNKADVKKSQDEFFKSGGSNTISKEKVQEIKKSQDDFFKSGGKSK